RRLDGLRGAVQLAILLVVVPVDGRVEHVVLVARRERDLLGAGGAGDDGQGDERRDQGRDNGCSMAHRPPLVADGVRRGASSTSFRRRAGGRVSSGGGRRASGAPAPPPAAPAPPRYPFFSPRLP